MFLFLGSITEDPAASRQTRGASPPPALPPKSFSGSHLAASSSLAGDGVGGWGGTCERMEMLLISNNNGGSAGSDKLPLPNERHYTSADCPFQYKTPIGLNLLGCSPGCSEVAGQVTYVSMVFGQVF